MTPEHEQHQLQQQQNPQYTDTRTVVITLNKYGENYHTSDMNASFFLSFCVCNHIAESLLKFYTIHPILKLAGKESHTRLHPSKCWLLDFGTHHNVVV